jgi:hypothetical protein
MIVLVGRFVRLRLVDRFARLRFLRLPLVGKGPQGEKGE